MKEKYYFGKSLIREFDFFAFPRTGSHFFFYCLSGLFDLVSYPHGDLDNEEAISRQQEINPLVLYALELREDGIAYQPVCFNSLSTGIHGSVKYNNHKFIVLIREPISVVYSLFRVSTSRWKQQINDLHGWVQQKFMEYNEFYTSAFNEIEAYPQESFLMRYEDLIKSSDPLKKLVEFVDLRPKLSPDFVFSVTNFGTFAKDTNRTFYREGGNEVWRKDKSWEFAWSFVKRYDFARFGYT